MDLGFDAAADRHTVMVEGRRPTTNGMLLRRRLRSGKYRRVRLPHLSALVERPVVASFATASIPSPSSLAMIPDAGASESLLARASHGYRATLLSQGARVLCKVASVVVLSRLVPPGDHGRFVMAASLTGLLLLFRDFGLGTATIQAPDLSEGQRTALWWTHCALGIGLTLATLAFTPIAVWFYHEPGLTPLLAVMSASFLFIGAGGFPRSLLARDLRFAEINRLETIAAVVATGAMIVAGALGAGAYSFATFLLVSEGIAAVEAWRVCGWRPHEPPGWASLRGLLRTGSELTGYNLIACVQQQLDTFLMGKWFGATTLGLYNRAGQLLVLPALHVTVPLTNVMLAALSRLGVTSPHFTRHWRETTNFVLYLTLPLAAACLVLPDEMVRLVLGPNWAGAAPLLRWLAVSASTVYLTATIYGLCVVTGNTRRLAAMAAMAVAVVFIGLWAGRTYGPVGLAAGLAGAQLVLLPLRAAWAVRGTPVRLSDFVAAWAGPLVLASVFGGGLAAGRALAFDASWMIRLSAALASGLAVAALCVWLWPRVRRELHQVWSHRPRPRDFATSRMT